MGDGLDQIKDLKLIIQIMDFLGMPTEGLSTVDEMKAKIRDYLVKSRMKRVSEPQYQAISDASKSDERRRRNLQNLYKKTATFLDKLDTKVKIALQERFGDFKATLEENMSNLLPRNEYPVLVAGETSAGKSSLINLILGEDLLPSAHLCTTFTICELKYGDKPKICLHFKNDGTQAGSPVTHELIGSPEKSYKDQINQFVSKRDDPEKTPYKKIELFWPHPLLKEKVVIVDSPGVGESEVTNEFVVKYMPNALCFIYVINSGNAGGVQEDRLGMLISCAQANLTENDLALFNRCALFVCNKWDCVDSNEQEKVKEEQIKLLSKKVFNLDPNAQMVHLSCKIAQVFQTRLGYVTEGFHDLTTGICNLFVSSMQNKLEMHYRWLEDVLFHVSRELKLSLETTRLSQQKTEEKISRVKKRIQELQESQQRKFDELSKFQSEILEDIITKLTEYFKSDEAVKKFCEWSSSEAPEVQATWKETKSEVLKCISKRAQQFTQSWEEETHAFAKAQDRLITHCCEKYDIMEKEIHQVEEYVFSDEVDTEVKQEEYAIRIRPRALSVLSRRIEVITGALPSWQRQGIVPVCVRSFGSMSDLSLKKPDEKIKRQRYQDDPCGYMSHRSRKCLVLIGSQDRLLPFIKKQLKDAIDCLRGIKERIRKLLDSDREMYQKLLVDDRSKKEIREIYEPLTTEAELLERELNVFNLAEMRKSDFTSDELKWGGDDSIIGSGTFSTVYRGILAQRRKPEVAVAIKEYKDPLTSRNLWHYFADEERPLRKLQHPGIVKYFGTCLLHETIGTTVKIVLELCDCSLRKLVTSHPENSPARLSKKPIRNKVLNWALQVLDALRYIHSVGFVHRDLKLDNLLLTHDGQVKLADVGIGKYEGQLTGTVFGTSLYLAPEVCKGRMYDSRADMYSFGFVLWELWYGEVSFRNMILSREPSKLLEDIKCGLRPSHIDKTSEPFPTWREVMESCWEKDPKERMKAGDALKCLNQAKLPRWVLPRILDRGVPQRFVNPNPS